MEKENFFVEMKEMVEEYAEDRIMLLKLQATEKAAKISSSLFLGAIVGALGLVVFIIFSFIAGFYLSIAVNSYTGGYAILGGIYVLLILLVIYIHNRYTGKIVADKVVKFSFDNQDNFSHAV